MYQEKAQLPHRGEPKAENLDQLSRLRSPREPRPLAWYLYLDFFLFCSSFTNNAKVNINMLDSEKIRQSVRFLTLDLIFVKWIGVSR